MLTVWEVTAKYVSLFRQQSPPHVTQTLVLSTVTTTSVHVTQTLVLSTVTTTCHTNSCSVNSHYDMSHRFLFCQQSPPHVTQTLLLSTVTTTYHTNSCSVNSRHCMSHKLFFCQQSPPHITQTQNFTIIWHYRSKHHVQPMLIFSRNASYPPQYPHARINC